MHYSHSKIECMFFQLNKAAGLFNSNLCLLTFIIFFNDPPHVT